jgi:hypothetical protein
MSATERITIEIPISGQEVAETVSTREYQRLLQVPLSHTLEGDMLERANSAREWYALNGKPYVAIRRFEMRGILPPVVTLSDGTELTSSVLAKRLLAGEAHALVVMAVSAGAAASDEIARLWKIEHPDEAFFLDRFAVAVTERLVFWTSGILCRDSEPTGETLMQHLAPGCGSWDFSDQHKLMALLTGKPATEEISTLGPLQLFPTGALHPQHSYMAAAGVTHRKLTVTPQDLCRACDLSPCSFRRAPRLVGEPWE